MQINEIPNDPILTIWKNNYNKNLQEHMFSTKKAKPIKFLLTNRFYQKCPIVLVAAGPSIDKNIELLKQYKNNCLILCVDVVLFKLIENDIEPDFVVSIDPSDSISRFWKDIETENLTFICPTTVSIASLKNWKGNVFFFNQNDIEGSKKQELLKQLTKPTAGFGELLNRFFVGATMYQISLLFIPSVIILVGYDFAFTSGKPYCDGFLERKLYDLNNIGMDILKQREYAPHAIVSIDDTIVGTTNSLQLYKDTLVELVNSCKIKTINSTEGGILTECMRMPLKDSLEEFCKNEIKKHDVATAAKRKKKKKRR